MRRHLLALALLSLSTTSMEESASAQVLRPTPLPAPTPTLNTITPPNRLSAVPASKASLQIGTGISDITGPAAEVGMMGYGKSDQITSGIQTRLWARAFIFANPSTNKRVVIVSAELGQLFSAVKQGVIAALATNPALAALYNEQNVQIAATHTHSGPGGYAHHFMYNTTSLGFIQQNFDAIVGGIVAAITQAHSRLEAGNAAVAQGELTDASVQRAGPAFNKDPESKANPPVSSINPNMTVLRLNRAFGAAKGTVAWFAVHNASVSRENTLISSDNKGHAALLFEKSKGTIMPFVAPGGFVAGFPNADEGDISANTGPNFSGPNGRREFDAAAIIGEKQFQKAEQLFNTANEDVGSDIDFRYTSQVMADLALTNASRPGPNNTAPKLCRAAYGMSFAAGAKDGPTNMTLPGGLKFTEGMKVGSFTPAAITTIRQTVTMLLGGKDLTSLGDSMWTDPCQGVKPILVPSGILNATANHLPFQILRIGSLAVLGVPGEMTSVAGRRLTSKVQAILAPKGVKRVIITGLANEYSGYITTPEEYDEQLYEGASTMFGPLTFDAYLQIFLQLARDMAEGKPSFQGTPAPRYPNPATLQTGVVMDAPKAGETMGTVLNQPAVLSGSYGEKPIVARFRSGHPKNDLRLNDTYFTIEKKEGVKFERIVWDAMPEAIYRWKRDGDATSPHSYVEVSWSFPVGTTGTFRIKHMGSWKTGPSGPILPYTGTTNEFEIRSEPAQCRTLRAQEVTLLGKIESNNRAIDGLNRAQQDCQAGRGAYAGQGGGKPRQCTDLEDRATKTRLQTENLSINGQLTTLRTTKASTGCVN